MGLKFKGPTNKNKCTRNKTAETITNFKDLEEHNFLTDRTTNYTLITKASDDQTCRRQS
jgi:hypothetical protein